MNYKFSLNENKMITNIFYGNIRVNQFDIGILDKPVTTVYLRVLKNKFVENVVNLLEIATTIQSTDKAVKYISKYGSITYTFEGEYIYTSCDISLPGKEFDLIYTFDIGLGDDGLISTNESYASQYMDNSIIDYKSSKTLAFRRSIDSESGNPGALVGSKDGIIGYSTDGYQLYDTKYKTTNVIEGLYKYNLPNEIYQYEFTLAALKTKIYDSSSNEVFFFKLYSDLENRLLNIEDLKSVNLIFDSELIADKILVNHPKLETFTSKELHRDEIISMYPSMDQIEEINGEIYSFFLENSTHVVTNIKEKNMERNHGTILISGNSTNMDDKVICSTNYMNGFMNGQVAIGNTKFNQFTTPLRNSLNVHKSSGQRLVVTYAGERFLLSTPSIFEIGLNYVKYIYKNEEIEIEVINYISTSENNINMEIKSSKEIYIELYTFKDPQFESGDGKIFVPSKSSLAFAKCPSVKFEIVTDLKTINAEKHVLNTGIGNAFNLSIFCFKDNIKTKGKVNKFSYEVEQYNNYMRELGNNFKVKSSKQNITKFNHLYLWYIHNSLIHFSSPKGLEQYVGAAWGTRDVLQGSIELFKTLGRFDINKKIILKVFKNQFFEDGSWPQWFMYDEYSQVCADESHGDVIVWPIKALAEYVNETKDYAIFDEQVEYKKLQDNMLFTNEKYTIKEHLLKLLDYIYNNLFMDTNLSSYGDGDWDDTLQPKDTEQRKSMVSGWTTLLTYQAIEILSNVLKVSDLKLSEELALFNTKLKSDYHKYIIKDGIASGFIYYKDNKILNLLHPTDNFTNIDYRLLPINRGIISGLFTTDEIQKHLNIVRNELECVDGIRLMNKPARYNGGINTIFKRAEQASSVGREVGLLYVHAHLRFAEAMTVLNDSSALYRLNQVQPIDTNEYVRTSNLRQRNSYFSSSEGAFKTRYEFQENFDKLKKGTVQTKSGWRIYSSGPGIYLNQLLRNVIGIKVNKSEVIFAPVLDKDFNNTILELSIKDIPCEFRFESNADKGLFIENKKIVLKKLYYDSKNTFGCIQIDDLLKLGDKFTVNF